MDYRHAVEYRDSVVAFMLELGGYWLDPDTRTVMVIGQEHSEVFPIKADFIGFSAFRNGVEWFVFGKHTRCYLERSDVERILAHIEAIKANAVTESASTRD